MISDASIVVGATSLVVNLDGTQVFSTAVTVPATANAGFPRRPASAPTYTPSATSTSPTEWNKLRSHAAGPGA
jgi:hypothetical protein